MTAPTAASSYEALYQRMQEIVAQLEAGELPLAEAMALYEEGIYVAAACQRILDEAELRVQELQTNPTTSLTSDEE
ncbi:MAG: exodeoxyribonuclease VII small subunit [Chloroflexi bacterium AL-W]|nr:exodeoxyribonuclease VII small subunit [Chloroflexi bacterium AL-N1]NOK70610.1 exodeoxyribonuclease VII small subunit [Chloroflexi bacterium AL-N10]NOK77602.1 exodeoxyribonuclease VII small subunit [Chloroflexi bacterium AL-N5]NOK84453.1 exodeoxyribonuclease VII small subunit [Chloroflexi bacterium AL-W]NOK92342.1 exodeoxyribonuclease VII small subunit [Chloroflexi bacterium AL-N15]